MRRGFHRHRARADYHGEASAGRERRQGGTIKRPGTAPLTAISSTLKSVIVSVNAARGE